MMQRCLLTLFLSISASFCLPAIEIYVSPGASETGDGTRERPFRSIHDARDLARTFAGKEPVTVWIGDGIHYLDQTLQFKAEDGGTGKYPLYYRALHEGKAVISGGKRLEVEWTPYRDGIHVCRVPEGLLIDQLFMNGRRQEMARFPNSKEGKNVFDHWTLSHSAEPDPEHDPLAAERIAHWQNPQGAYLHAMHRALWGGMHYRVTGKNMDGTLELEGGWQNNRPARIHGTYRFIEHIFEELDAPGEWYHNREESRLYYYPGTDLDLHKAEVEVVSLRHLVEFNGSMDRPVCHIHLEGLVFKHAARTFMENREPLLRSDWTTYRGGALFFNGAAHCSVTRCELDQLGGNSIFVNNYNRDITISGCHIHESGANGIAFVGDPAMVRNPIFRYGSQDYGNLDLTPGPRGENYPSGCMVYDCIVERTGRTEKQTAPIQISMSHRITVSHCSIYDVPRAGINISEGTFGGHVIEYCDVFNTVLETGDHGSFNSWGRDRFWDPDIPTMNREVGNNPRLPFLDMVEPNTIRNSRWRCDHGWDIDLDDGSSHYRIYNNLLLNGGLKLREGYHRVVTNNIVVNNGLHPHVWPRNNGDVITGNIFFTSHRAIAMTRGMEADEKWGKEIDYNVFTSNHADRLLYARNGCDLHSIVADPGFRDPESGDFSIDPGSPLAALGFVNFDMTSFGVVTPHLRSIARVPLLPELQMHTDTTGADGQPGEEILWNDARLKEPRGSALSAYGMGLGTEGVAMADVPRFSGAWAMGFRTGDFILEVNGKKAGTMKKFISLMEKGGKQRIKLVRNQEETEINIK
jgi:hypothetical protein